ncbi:MAG: hypothetical protein K1X53_16425 [Candidatus Sumerlaeaceae bacterium]|nr:hypothetical protein [Candidatus Sumerlaeaceae bacterium]
MKAPPEDLGYWTPDGVGGLVLPVPQLDDLRQAKGGVFCRELLEVGNVVEGKLAVGRREGGDGHGKGGEQAGQ